MNAAHNIPLDMMLKSHLVPQAIVSQPPAFFASRGARFRKDHDDLNEFVVSTMALDGTEEPFALLRYVGTPENETTVFLREEVPQPVIRITLLQILEAFGLTANEISWMRANGDTPY